MKQIGLFEEEPERLDEAVGPELPRGYDLVKRAFTGIFCGECNGKDGHFHSCSRYTGGLPSTTEFGRAEMRRIASHCVGPNGLNEPVTLCYILNQPYVVVEVTGNHAQPDEAVAYPVVLLPLANLWDANAQIKPEVEDFYIGHRVNCGSIEHPNWWVIMGSRQIFKIGREPKKTYGPNIEQALHSALHSFEGAEKRWRTLIESGASDADLMSAIAREFGSSGGSTRHGGYKHKGGKNPEFSWPHYSGRSNLTHLKGKRLLTMVRSILGIGPSRTAIYGNYHEFVSSSGDQKPLF